MRGNRPCQSPANPIRTSVHPRSVGVAAFQASHQNVNSVGNYLTSANLSFISLSSSPPFFHNSRCPSESMASQHPIVAGSVRFTKPADQAFQYGTAGVSQSALTIDTGRLSVLRSVSHESVSSTTRIS